jgi:hypothetical protein
MREMSQADNREPGGICGAPLVPVNTFGKRFELTTRFKPEKLLKSTPAVAEGPE